MAGQVADPKRLTCARSGIGNIHSGASHSRMCSSGEMPELINSGRPPPLLMTVMAPYRAFVSERALSTTS